MDEVIGVAWNPGQCGSWLAEVPHGIKKEKELTEANIKEENIVLLKASLRLGQ